MCVCMYVFIVLLFPWTGSETPCTRAHFLASALSYTLSITTTITIIIY